MFTKDEGEIYQDRMQACGILFDINAMVYFKFNLQLKCRNRNDCSVSVNFLTGLAKEYIDLKLKCRNREIKSCRDKRTDYWDTVISLLLKPLSSASTTSRRSGFRNRCILDLFCSNALIIFVLFIPNGLDRRIYETIFPRHASPPPHFVFL